MTPQQIEAMKLALEALKNNKRTHLYCEDIWYSCPKHEDGCANEAEGDECNCGADDVNAQFDQAITALEEALAQPEQIQPSAYSNTHQPEQEPVAMVESVATVVSESGNQEVTMSWWHEPALPVGTKLYTKEQL